MILALLLTLIASALVSHSGGLDGRDLIALLLVAVAVWLMLGGGERWVKRRESRRARLP